MSRPRLRLIHGPTPIVRRPALDAMVLHGVAERERWLDTWFTAEARERITAAAARLRG